MRERTALSLARAARLGIFVALAALALSSRPALAQLPSVPPPPVYSAIDDNGVDLVSGALLVPSDIVSVGQAGAGALVYVRTWDSTALAWRDNVAGAINSNGATYTVTLQGASQQFTLSGGVFTPTQGQGGSLTFNAGTNQYTLTTASGAVAVYYRW